MIIQAKNYISTGFGSNDAKTISNLIDDLLRKEESVTIDFSGIDFYCTYFFNRGFTFRLDTMSQEEYDSKIKIIGLNKTGTAAYNLSYDNSVDYFKIPFEMRKARNEEIAELVEELIN
ncbi:hypothetical protein MmiEs2_06310 [Methanimicrococcus stummii]|uniref:DUF4325 domain-containing protein n=1 Tax=Methanimicrococcus stummii TaxID=3028294 RepID=A0AA96ZWY0_9EURY|nr:DUF4325 domain-containing protein [Methanimicrococcus sp. Es2]WNY28445.1 hypothetical protein MmiEs2_06310 [Methanimicrococcus sp. Es2]